MSAAPGRAHSTHDYPSAPATTGPPEAFDTAQLSLLLVAHRGGLPLRTQVEHAQAGGSTVFRMRHVGQALVNEEVKALLEDPPAGLQVECGSNVLAADDALDRQIMRVLLALAQRRARPDEAS